MNIYPRVQAGLSVVEALLELPEGMRPCKVMQICARLCLDKNTRRFYLANQRARLIVLLDTFPRSELLAFLRGNNL